MTIKQSGGSTYTEKSAPRILAVCAIDLMAWKLLRPWFRGLADAGYELHIACTRTTYFEMLEADGFHMHNVPIQRRMNPLAHIAPLWSLYRLIRRERFLLVNMHSPVAAAVGRVAAWLANGPGILYTVHGFYFHDDMPKWKRRAYVGIEWLLGSITGGFMFVSDEDRQTAIREGIVRDPSRAMTICNGVDLDYYLPKASAGAGCTELRAELNIPQDAAVVGIVGRVVREKGYLEFAEMASLVSAVSDNVFFLVVGDALSSDRDGIVAELRGRVEAAGLADRFRFTGFTDRVARYLNVMDIFVLPSYREGFPRSVLEAMSCELPVVATNIRGCREAIIHGETGLLVPPRNGAALAEAIIQLLQQPDLARAMGRAGRQRAVRLYDQRIVLERFVNVIVGAHDFETKRARPRYLQRFLDVLVSGCGLIILAPLLAVIAAVVRAALGPPPIFAQARVGLTDRVFTLYKFRTMTGKRDDAGNLLPDEQRLTALGKFLRSTSLDELPQLWNVFKGDMSLVGPRPLLPEYLPRYNAFQRRRHEVKPGITGWVQVNGRNSLTWDQKFELDVWYVDNRSPALDLKILWLTILKVIHREGVSQDGSATMPEFRGNQP